MNIDESTVELASDTKHYPELNVNHLSYFPTSVFSAMADEANISNSELLEAIYQERKRDEKGVQRSNIRALGGWHSHNELHKKPEYQSLIQLVNKVSSKISLANGYHERYELKIGTMWSIINPPGGSNQAHLHPGSHWSGVYYVHAPKDSGDIEFFDPRTQNLIMQPKCLPNKRRPKHCWTKVHFTPIAGKILLFPSWLYHAVAPNLSTEKGSASERVIISFNLTQEKVSGTAGGPRLG